MKKWIGLSLCTCILVIGYSCKNRPVDHSEGFSAFAVNQTDIRLIIHLRNADGFKISLCPLTGSRANSPVRVIEATGSDVTDTIIISHNYLPGEFVLNFDRTSGAGNVPVHYSQYLIVSSQDIELWINPLYGDYPDSTWFQPEEKENNAYRRFIIESENRRVLLNQKSDTTTGSEGSETEPSWKCVREYNKRRVTYNNWVRKQIRANRRLFLSQVLEFERYPDLEEVNPDQSRQLPGMSYLDEVSFSNPMIIRASGIKRWMDGYIKHFEENFGSELSDSMLVVAGITSIEKVKSDNSLIYGWMTDYYYELFAKNNIIDGIIKLQPYIEDPSCLTSFRRMLIIRETGRENIIVGKTAPDLHFINSNEDHYALHAFMTSSGFKLLYFWSTGCMQCLAATRQLYTWWLEQDPESSPAVFAVNLDESYDKEGWIRKVAGMPGWEHMIDDGGTDSEAANSYGVLSTPFMVVIDARTGKIVGLPDNLDDFKALMVQLQH